MPPCLGSALGRGHHYIYFPLGILLIAVQVLLVTSVQAILMTVIVRWVPARLARDVAAAVAGLTGAALYLTWNLSLRQTFRSRTRPDVSGLTSLVQRIDWLPTTWPGHALSAIASGSVAFALVWLLATLLLAAILVTTAELLYERTLLAGLGVFGDAPAIWRRRSTRRASPQPSPLRGDGNPYIAMAKKDWLGFRRDVRRLTRLLPALLLPVGYAAALSQPARSLSGFWSNVALVTFLSMFMASALALPSIPSERRRFRLPAYGSAFDVALIRAKVFIAFPVVVATYSFSASPWPLSARAAWRNCWSWSSSACGWLRDSYRSRFPAERSIPVSTPPTIAGRSAWLEAWPRSAVRLDSRFEPRRAGAVSLRRAGREWRRNLGPIPSTPASASG